MTSRLRMTTDGGYGVDISPDGKLLVTSGPDSTAIVWDLDGTLIHFKIDFIKARKESIKIFLDNGVPENLLSLKSKILDNAKIARNFFELMGISESKINEIMQEANSAIAKVEYEAAINPTMVKGIDKVLEFAKNHNLKQAIFTYNTKENAKISLANINLLHYFEVIVGRDNIMSSGFLVELSTPIPSGFSPKTTSLSSGISSLSTITMSGV